MVQNRPDLERRFQRLVAECLKANGLDVAGEELASNFIRPDLILRGRGKLVVVELKLYRSLRISSETIERALWQVEALRRSLQASGGILVINARLDLKEGSFREHWPHLRIIDFDQLHALASASPGLVAELEDVVRETLVFRGGDLPTPDASVPPPELTTLFYETPDTVPGALAPPARGQELCRELRKVPKSDGQRFERACINAVKFLFANDLTAWTDQHTTDTQQHRFDLIARVSSKEDLWETLVRDFRARYVVFEFKNYQTKIAQGQIYTTEKYLYPVATRGAAIIISRLGADDGAQRAIRGALREAGKLILSLSIDDVCMMLHAKDEGGDHLTVLVERLDEMLMGLER